MAFNPYKKYRRKKVCRFCNKPELKIDYKNIGLIRRFTNESGKIKPRRATGNCAKHQRMMAKEVKKAREMALIHYVAE